MTDCIRYTVLIVDFQITPRQLNQAISLLNRHPILQNHDLQNNRKICVVGLCCYPALAAVITAIVFIFVLATREHQSSDNQLTVNLLIICIIPAAVVMAIIFCVCLCRYGKRKIKKVKINCLKCSCPLIKFAPILLYLKTRACESLQNILFLISCTFCSVY